MNERILHLYINIYHPQSFSLKDKRSILQPLIQNLKSKHNISLLETGLLDNIKNSQLTLAMVCINESSALQQKQKLIETIIILCESCEAFVQFESEIL